jgi:hypothetical protein
MTRRIIIGFIALILIIIGVILLINRKDKTVSTPVLSVSAFNQTKNVPAENTVPPNDEIVYTLNAENQGDEVISGYIVEANISEITDKATLIDASGASYNAGTNSLVWTPLDIQPHQSIAQKFSVRVNPLPAGSANTTMRIKFNNELALQIVANAQVSGNVTNTPNPPGAQPYHAPVTGASEWVPTLLALVTTIGYYAFKKYRLAKV